MRRSEVIYTTQHLNKTHTSRYHHICITVDNIQNNMVDRPLPVVDMTQKLQSKTDIPNVSFALSVDINRPPSSPNLSDEPDYDHLMAIKMRNAEAPLTSRSCSSSSSVDEIVSHLPRNVDKLYEADVDSEDTLSSDNEVIKRAPSCGTLNQLDTCEHCGLLRHSAAPTDLHSLEWDNSFQHCICHLTSSQPKPADHRRLKHRLNKVAASQSSSLGSTENASLMVESYSPYQNSSQGHTSFVEEEEEDMENANYDSLPTDDESTFLASAAGAFNGGKTKKNNIREKVDPRKYFVVVDGPKCTKYVCSVCASMYVWRKSVNKHWKEKHCEINIMEVTNFTGITKFMKTGRYTLVGERQLYDAAYLRTIKIAGSDNTSCATSSQAKLRNSPQQSDMPNISTSLPGTSNFTSPHLPPFGSLFDSVSAAHTAFSHFLMSVPHVPIPNYNDSSEVTALDLSSDRHRSSRDFSISGTQNWSSTLSSNQQPINLSRGSNAIKNVTLEIPQKRVKSVMPSWSVRKSVKELPQYLMFESSSASETESSTNAHMRVATCHECQLQKPSMEKLNKHFTKHHIQKLSDYKETMKRIPYGLQQAYHLLKMEHIDIAALSNQDLGLPDGMSLKCKKCDFETWLTSDFERHCVSHAEERPYECLVCGATYKFKWDLVKHFEKSHTNLPNPYRRNNRKDPRGSLEEGEPLKKIAKLELSSTNMNSHHCNRNETDSVKVVTDESSGQTTVSCQQTGLGSAIEKKHIDQHTGPTDVEGAQKEQMAEMCKTRQKNSRSHKLQAEQPQQHMSCNDSHMHSGSTRSRVMRKDSHQGSKPEKTLKNQRKVFICSICSMEYSFHSELLQHQKKHSDVKPYKCCFCEYRSKYKWDTVKHERRCPGRYTNDINENKSTELQTFMEIAPQNAPGNQKSSVKRTTRQPPLPSLNQSANESACFPLDTETQADSPKSDSKTSKRKNRRNAESKSNSAMVNKNQSPQTSGLQLAILKQATPTTSTEDAMASTSSSIASAKPSRSHARHSRDVSKPSSWKCFYCSFTTHIQVEFKRHLQELHNDDKPFKCDQCNYKSKWPGDLKTHKRIYKHFSETEIEETEEELQALFKCSRCIIYFDTLQKLVDHCFTNHGEELHQNFTRGVMENGVDMARIKHPRKRMSLIECSQCPFICTSQQMMDTHSNENTHCYFCKSAFRDKDTFFDHIILHPEFVPKEWELKFRIGEEERHRLKSDRKTNQRADNKQHGKPDTMEISQNHSTCKEEKEITTGTDTSLNRIQPVQVEMERSRQEGEPQFSLYTCEWCHAGFMYLTDINNHARNFHPVELKEQEARMKMADDGSPQMSLHIDINRERDYNLVDKNNQEFVSAMQVGLNKKLDDNIFNLSLASVACMKQPIDCKAVFLCPFCDFYVKDAELLEKHMATSHKCGGQGPKQNSISETDHHGISPASFSTSTRTSQDRDSVACSLKDATNLSSKNGVAHKITYIPRQQNTWKHVPINVVFLNGKLNFVCPHCTFQNASIAKTNNHIMQNHKALRKYSCKTCKLSNDDKDVMFDHCEQEHQQSERVVEILNFEEIDLNKLQMLIEKPLTCDVSKDKGTRPRDKSGVMKKLRASIMSL